MVKFGERLPGLMRKGWESKYIDYAKLKRIIENMSGDAKASDDFFSNLEQEIAKVDTFVASTVNDLRKQFGSDESTKAANAKKVQKELAVLRAYVGTNIVAATKIVKKHDKNYSEQKREKVSALLHSAPGMSAVPGFQREINAALSLTASAPVLTRASTKEMKKAFEDDDDDDSEAKLKSLAGWLLADSEAVEPRVKEVHNEFFAACTRPAFPSPPFFYSHIAHFPTLTPSSSPPSILQTCATGPTPPTARRPAWWRTTGTSSSPTPRSRGRR